MDEIIQRQQERFRFLRYVYEKCEGTAHRQVGFEEIAQALNLSEVEVKAVFMYLMNEGLAHGTRGSAGLTHKGVKEVERALTEPFKLTKQLPTNVINIGNVSHASIHVGGGRALSQYGGQN